MSTSKEEIREWFERGQQLKATHMLVVCDTYDFEDYPVYVMPSQKVQVLIEHNTKDMSKVMEVYALHLDCDQQLNASWVWNTAEKQ